MFFYIFMVKENVSSYKPCIITNPKKRIVYVPMHSENHLDGNISDCEGFYPKEIDNYHLGQVGILLKQSKKELRKLDDLCCYGKPVKIVNPLETVDYIKPISGAYSFHNYLKDNLNNIFNKMVFVMVCDPTLKNQVRLIPFHLREVLPISSEDKIIEWVGDDKGADGCIDCMKQLSILRKSYNDLNERANLLDLPIEWAPYANIS